MDRGVTTAVTVLAAAGAAALAAALWAAFYHAPIEVEMGVVQKIFYIHLPLALGSFAAFLVNCIASCGYLATRRRGWDHLAVAGAETGLLLATLTLVTGSLWARPIWNTWWTWEPRLTTMFLLWLLYLGYVVLRGSLPEPERRARFAAVWGILAFADVPLVYFSIHWWDRGLHPVVVEPGRVALEAGMVRALLASLTAFALLTAALVLLRTGQAALEERLEALAPGSGCPDAGRPSEED
jgi:heme exporter protein C